MALYIKPENQILLWKTMNKVQLFNQIPQNERENWFKNIIQMFYENNKNYKISSKNLKELNKQTINHMIQKLNTLFNSNTKNNLNYDKISNNQDFISVNNTTDVMQPIPTIKNTRQSDYSMEYENRQKEYERMMKKDIPPEPIFKEQTEDTAIDNMDELIKQQMQQRELDIQQIELQNKSKSSKRVSFIEKLDLSNVHKSNDIILDNIQLFNNDNDFVTKNEILLLNEKIDKIISIIQKLEEKILKNDNLKIFDDIQENCNDFSDDKQYENKNEYIEI